MLSLGPSWALDGLWHAGFYPVPKIGLPCACPTDPPSKNGRRTFYTKFTSSNRWTADSNTLKIHLLLHKTFDKTLCFRPFSARIGTFHAGFKYEHIADYRCGAERRRIHREYVVLVLTSRRAVVPGKSRDSGDRDTLRQRKQGWDAFQSAVLRRCVQNRPI